MVASETLEAPAGQVVKTCGRVGILVESIWPTVIVLPETVRLPPTVALFEMVKVPIVPKVAKRLVDEAVVVKKLVVVALVPVAKPKEKLEKLPIPPETVAPVREELVKVPPSVKLEMLEESLPESAFDWRVTVGRVSARRISSRKTVVL